jgi:hypothetical protein
MLVADLVAAVVALAGPRAAARLARADASLRRLVEDALRRLREGAGCGLVLHAVDSEAREVLAWFPQSSADDRSRQMAIDFAARTARECAGELSELLGLLVALHDATIARLGDVDVFYSSHAVVLAGGSRLVLTRFPPGVYRCEVHGNAADLSDDEGCVGSEEDAPLGAPFLWRHRLRGHLSATLQELPRCSAAWRALDEAAAHRVGKFARAFLARVLADGEAAAILRESIYCVHRREALAGWSSSGDVLRREARARLLRV